jgi:PAS domain S-box-containing protein
MKKADLQMGEDDDPSTASQAESKPSHSLHTLITPILRTERYASLFESVPIGLYCTTPDGDVLDANPALATLLGFCHADELLGRNVRSLYVDPDQRAAQLAAVVQARTPQVTEICLRRQDGAHIWVRDTFGPVYDGDGRLLHFEGSLEEITQQRQTFNTLRRLNRALRAVMQCNEAVMHARDSQSLLDQVCGILVEDGGYLLAWVGHPETDEDKTVRSIAARGRAQDYLAVVNVTWGDDLNGAGPMGVALRTGRLGVCRDIVTDPVFAPWRELALAHGFRSTVAVPLLVRGRPVAAIGVYAGERDAFDDEENRLLEAMARNVAFGMTAQWTNAERDQLLQALYESERRLTTMLENVPLLAMALDCDGVISFCNEFLLRVVGLPRSRIIGSSWIERFIPAAGRAQAEAVFTKMLDAAAVASQFESEIVTEQGELRTISWDCTTNRDLDARVVGVTFLGEDITDHLRAAAARDELMTQVIAAHERLQALSRQLVRMQEIERRNLSRELHDEIGQSLTGLKMMLDVALKTPEKAAVSLRQAQVLLNELIGKVRELSLDLRPGMLDDLGLLPALLWLFDRYTMQTNVQISFKHAGIDGQRFASEMETAAYRLIQEALTNVARHAGVDEAQVQVAVSHNTMHIEVGDRGRGFDPRAVLTSGYAAGLSGLRERAVLLGGQFAIESMPGHGTRVIADLPVI